MAVTRIIEDAGLQDFAIGTGAPFKIDVYDFLIRLGDLRNKKLEIIDFYKETHSLLESMGGPICSRWQLMAFMKAAEEIGEELKKKLELPVSSPVATVSTASPSLPGNATP